MAPPPIQRQMELIEATYEGASPQTVDPAWAYDTNSYELIYNVYETLVTFDGERMNRFLPSLAESWAVVQLNPPQISPEGLTWYYEYIFKIRESVQWQDPTYGYLTPEDVEYSIERSMVQSRSGGPSWTLYEPLLNVHSPEELGDLTDPSTVVRVGRMIDNAVQVNATHVILKSAYPVVYTPMFQFISQPYWSIVCKDWINALARYDWRGEWGDYTGWINFHNPVVSPLDDPAPVMMGTGPFALGTVDYVEKFWDAYRHVNWWRGWPCPFPAFGGSKPAGYVDHIKKTWALDSDSRLAAFLNGEVDIADISPNYDAMVINQPDIRRYFPLPPISYVGLGLTSDIDPSTVYGPILEPGNFSEIGIPRDFFDNIDWGHNVRQAFAYAIYYADIIRDAYYYWADRLGAAIIETQDFLDMTIGPFETNYPEATALLQSIWELWGTGFLVHLCIEKGNPALHLVADIIKTSIEGLNAKFHVIIDDVADNYYFNPVIRPKWYPMFLIDRRIDSTSPHASLVDYYHSKGFFARLQGYANPEMDAMIDEAIILEATDPIQAQARYSEIQQLAHDELFNIAICNYIGRHYERTSVVGYYYQPLLYGTGTYFANLWKWYYTPHAQQDSILANSTGNLLPYDVNYDGKTNMVDIGTTAASFGAIYGPPMSVKWMYRADFNNDRKVDMKDIGGVAKNFGKICSIWTPS